MLNIDSSYLEKSLDNFTSTEEEPYLSPSNRNDAASSSSEIYHMPDQSSSHLVSEQSHNIGTNIKVSGSFSSISSVDAAIVSEIISPNQFSIQRKKMDDVFKCKIIQHVKKAKDLVAPKIRSLAFVRVAEDWLRGKIENIHIDGDFTIYFVDIGITQKMYCPKYEKEMFYVS